MVRIWIVLAFAVVYLAGHVSLDSVSQVWYHSSRRNCFQNVSTGCE